jgi:hypothetical protein
MVEEIEKILNKLLTGELKPEQKFSFDEPDEFEESGSSQEVHLDIKGTNYWINSDINWSCYVKEGEPEVGLREEYVLDYLWIDNFTFGDGEEEYNIKLNENPQIKRLFAQYITGLWSEQFGSSIGKQPRKLTNESVKKYDDFLLEWGYGGEGGVASKDPVKVSSRMITDINLEDDADDEEFDTYVPILKDMSENVEEEYGPDAPVNGPVKNLVWDGHWWIIKNGKWVIDDLKHQTVTRQIHDGKLYKLVGGKWVIDKEYRYENG